MVNSSFALGKLTILSHFSMLGMYIEKNGNLNWHIFFCQSLQNFNSIYLKMLYKVTLITITTINSTMKLIYVKYSVLIVAIP